MKTMNGGYFMIDCDGLDLTKQTAQTITGLYNRMKSAIVANKPVFAYNINFGENNPMTPICIIVNMESAESPLIVGTAATLQLYVTSADSVTIVNLAPQTRTKTK